MEKLYPDSIRHLKEEVGPVGLKENHTEHQSEEVWLALRFKIKTLLLNVVSASWFKFVEPRCQFTRKIRRHLQFCILRKFARIPLLQLCMIGQIVIDKEFYLCWPVYHVFLTFPISWLQRFK